jgi:hypothetical protein
MGLDYQRIRYKNNYYAVMDLQYKDINLPVIVDWDDFAKIKNLNKSWKCNKLGFVSCSHTYNDSIKEIFMHDIVMTLKQKDISEGHIDKAIIHINRIGLDNRRENLLYDLKEKDVNKNIKKKKRTIVMPANSGIRPNEIPTYVWYMKPNGSHGDRFMVEVGDTAWKTTSSKKLSLRYKLEEAKMYLRQLRLDQPELFEDYSMNGDYTKEGMALMDSYYAIIHRAGYTNIEQKDLESRTEELLKPGTFSRKEKDLLKQQGNLLDRAGDRKRRVIDRLPLDSGISISDIPKYCYYRPSNDTRGDYFVVENHPQQQTKSWQTSSSSKITTAEKYYQLMEYVENL